MVNDSTNATVTLRGIDSTNGARSRFPKGSPNLGYPIIYFIQAGDFIKIGRSMSNGLCARINAMVTGCPFEMEVLEYIKGDSILERQLHKKFSFCHYRGEWFKSCPELLNFIAKQEGIIKNTSIEED